VGIAGNPAYRATYLMSDEILHAFENAYRGQSCSVTRRENDWVFKFGDSGALGVTARWRLIQSGRIAHADEDDRQRFGLAHPVDGEARANGLLAEKQLRHMELDRVTADLHLHFDGDTCLDVFNNSSGYEGSQATFFDCGHKISVTGMGGGGVSIFRDPSVLH
jgi:hypothetical protein